jgi:iron complex outermembrane receptor protein
MVSFLLVILHANAQQLSCKFTIQGKIVEAGSGNPITDAMIYLEGYSKGTHSNETGQFALTEVCAGSYVLVCQHLNHELYKERIVVSQSDIHKRIVLNCHSDSLHQVTVKGARIHWEDVVVMNKMQGEDLFRQQGVSLGQALEKINGVYSLSTGANIRKPVLRGLHSNRILMLNNEIRQEGQQWGNEHAPEIDPFIAQNIEVVKGAQTIRYGSDVIGGVILVNPKPLWETNGIGGELQLSGFSNGRGGAVSAKTEGDHLSKVPIFWRLQGTLKRNGNVQTPSYFLKNTGLKEMNYSIAVGYKLKSMQVSYFHSYFNTHIGIFSGSHIGNLTDLYKAFEAKEPLDSSGFTYEIGLPYQHIIHQLHKVQMSEPVPTLGQFKMTYGFQQNIRREYDNTLQSKQPDGTYKPALHFKLLTHFFDAHLESLKKKSLEGCVGMNGYFQTNEYFGNYFIPNYKKATGGIYVTGKWHKRKMSAEAGVRYDVNQFQIWKWENNVLINPTHLYHGVAANFAARYQMSYITLHASTGTSWRAPFVNELYSYGVHHSAASFEIGDRTLKPERNFHNELTLDIHYKHKLDAELTVYYNYIHDYIIQQPVLPATLTIRGAFPTFQFTQANAAFSGIEFSSTMPIYKAYHMHVKGNLLQAKNLEARTYLPLIPPARAELELNGPLYSKEKTKIEWALTGSYTAMKQHIAPGTDYVMPPHDYFLLSVDVLAVLPIKQQLIQINVGANNLLNTRYRDYMDRNRYFADEMGRTIFLKFSIPFQFTQKK